MVDGKHVNRTGQMCQVFKVGFHLYRLDPNGEDGILNHI